MIRLKFSFLARSRRQPLILHPFAQLFAARPEPPVLPSLHLYIVPSLLRRSTRRVARNLDRLNRLRTLSVGYGVCTA